MSVIQVAREREQENKTVMSKSVYFQKLHLNLVYAKCLLQGFCCVIITFTNHNTVCYLYFYVIRTLLSNLRVESRKSLSTRHIINNMQVLLTTIELSKWSAYKLAEPFSVIPFHIRNIYVYLTIFCHLIKTINLNWFLNMQCIL